ncbi:MAG: aggregation factor core protein MAFp3, isoform C [Pseudomonadota bacterium]
MRLITATLALLGLSTAVQAEIVATFIESAPRDIFEIKNTGTCATGPNAVEVDLSGSAGLLIFDTSSAGAGVNVSQPFVLTEGAKRVLSVSPVTDGDQRIRFELSTLAPGEALSFTIDVDDQLPASARGQTRVDGGEIAGAMLRVRAGDAVLEAPFGAGSAARVAYSACLS